MMVKVAVIRCESYDDDKVREAVNRGLELIGGIKEFVSPGEKILLKPNLLAADVPEKCCTTHPSVFKAVAEAFLQVGVNLSYGDSPALHNPSAAAKKAGIADIAEKLGVETADFVNGEEIYFEEGIQNKKFFIAKGVLEADGLISLPKLKTHFLAKMTGSIKNQFGCVPGELKGEFHVRMPNINDFSMMLIDLNRLLKPRLYIMDGIMAMEGGGPRRGTPKKMNVLLLSKDPIALDAMVCKMVNLDPKYVPTVKLGKEVGFGTYLDEEIELVGDPFESFIDPAFVVKREPVKPFYQGGIVQFVRNALVPKPLIQSKKCLKCGECVRLCPVKPKALDWHSGNKTKVPNYKYSRCIRCYCCQEICPEGAISLKEPIVKNFFKGRKLAVLSSFTRKLRR
ncbi:MAG: DUF362 domain-containing protein [Clostridia bacterium]|nr:DUF362 domain-containing protein [Clostridia bacterium]